jgi:enoyl-CoA hydratase
MIKTEVIDAIGVLTLSRPKVHNAINRSMMTQIEEVLTAWKEDQQVKILVVTGEGERTFCSGGDIEEFHGLDGEATVHMLHHMKEVLFLLQTFPKPTVAALNGTAVGGGCEIATACDLRMAHPEVKVGFIQINLGITTGWGGATRLFEILPYSKALKLLLTGEKVSAQEDFSLGFIDEVLPTHDFMDHVLKWCKRITCHPLPALEAYKKTALDQNDHSITLKGKLDREVNRSAEVWGSPKHKKAVSSFLNRSNHK